MRIHDHVPRITITLLFAIPLLAAGVSLQQASAQPDLSDGSPLTTPCAVTPRSAADILELLVPPDADPPPVELAPPLPPGVPADPATVAEITAVVAELEACLNAGDHLRFYALLSDDWFRNLKETGDLTAELAAQATSRPVPRAEGYRETFIGPWHVMILEDQRALAAVIWFGSEDDLRLDPRLTRILIFVEDDGQWLIDEMIERVFVRECGHSVRAGAVVGPPPGAVLAAPPMSCDDITHEEKEPSKERYEERLARAAGTTTLIPAAVADTIIISTPVTE